MTRTGGYCPVLLVSLILVRGVPKLVVPVLCRRFIGGELFVPVFCLGGGGAESGRARSGVIVIFEIVVPVLGRSTLRRAGAQGRLLFLDRTRGSPRLINEVIVPVLGRIAWFENTLGRRHSRIGTLKIKIVVPILGVAGCRNVGEESVRVKYGEGDGPVSV